jgi:simple sugar transport system substrate-binding protein
MKKLLLVVLAIMLVFAAFALTGCGGDTDDGVTDEVTTTDDTTPAELIKVGIVNLHPSESGYREANVNDMAEVFTTDNGYDVKTANYNTLDEQINATKDFISQGVDYLLISAADENGWDAVLQEAKDAGIKVFLFDRMINVDNSLYEAAVVSDMANQGDTAVEWLANNDLDEYNIIHIKGQIGSAAQKGRSGALQAAVDAGTMNVVREGTGGDTWSGDEAKKVVEAAIAAGEKFNVIYAENDGMADGATKALDEAGIKYGVDGDVVIMGFDANRFALRNVMEGKWNYSGQCSPFQAEVIDGFIKQLVAGQTLSIPADKKVISEEKGFDHAGIPPAMQVTEEVIAKYGLGE